MELKTLAAPVVQIPGLSGQYVEISERYEYEVDKALCPACGGLGMPWNGWFSCESCTAKALVADGRCFVRLEGSRPAPAGGGEKP